MLKSVNEKPLTSIGPLFNPLTFFGGGQQCVSVISPADQVLTCLISRCVWTWSGCSTSSPGLPWAPWGCWTFSRGSSSPCPASWGSQTWMMSERRRPPVRQTQTALSSFPTETLLCRARLRGFVMDWTKRGIFTTLTGRTVLLHDRCAKDGWG